MRYYYCCLEVEKCALELETGLLWLLLAASFGAVVVKIQRFNWFPYAPGGVLREAGLLHCRLLVSREESTLLGNGRGRRAHVPLSRRRDCYFCLLLLLLLLLLVRKSSVSVGSAQTGFRGLLLCCYPRVPGSSSKGKRHTGAGSRGQGSNGAAGVPVGHRPRILR